MKIGIIGLGFVGLSFGSVLASKGHSVIGVDVDKEKLKKIKDGVIPFYEPGLQSILKKALKKDLKVSSSISDVEKCSLIFVTVGTPQKRSGEIDLTMVKNVIDKIGKLLSKTQHKPIIIIKSTVIPGTTRDVILSILQRVSGKKVGKDFGLVTNPEFLRETMAVHDTLYPHVIVLGGDNNSFLKKVKRFYYNLHHNVPIVLTNYGTAEIIKYANNSFLATKISFINQIANICEEIPDVNVDDVSRTIGLDPRIGKLFLNAGPGYGGSCLPKDMKALINFANISGINPTLLNAVEDINSKQLEQIITIAKQQLIDLKSKRVTVLGTSFKPNTDDIRDSISIELIKKLLKRKAKVTVHDPRAIKNTRDIFGKKIIYAKSMNDALLKSQCAIIMTEWTQYEKLNNNNFKHMTKKVVIDSRRMLIGKQLDVNYFGIGLGKEK